MHEAFDQLWVWDDRRVAGALAWYRRVAVNDRPAKYLIAATIPAAIAPERTGVADLRAELKRLTPDFVSRWNAIAGRGADLPEQALGPSLLEVAAALARRLLARCTFCEWNCRVDRSAGTRRGTCKLGGATRVSSYFHHPGEELVFRGTRGSGTIFFTSCNMRCAFCQNGDISTDKDNGDVVAPRTLATMAWLLRMEGCHNVNWVGGDPTIHLHTIVDAIALLGRGFEPDRAALSAALPTKGDAMPAGMRAAARAGFGGRLNAPMLWNSNFIMTLEAMEILRPLMDVWLPDFKFGPGDCAKRLARTPWYWDRVTRNLALLRDWGEDLTIRHLVMPNHVACCTRPVLDWIAQNLPDAPVNIMDQYRPDQACSPRHARYDPKFEDLSRRVGGDEVEAAWRHAERLGLAWDTITREKARAAAWR